MKQRLTMALRRTSDERACEFGEEALSGSRLSLSSTYMIRHALQAEYARIARNPIDGIYIVPSATDDFCWFGVAFIRAGVFSGGIFRFNVNIPKDFPNTTSLPQIIFNLPIFHPNITHKTRILDLSRFFPDGWKKEKHHLQYVLLVAQRIFFSIDADEEECSNPEAAKLWCEDKHKFKETAKEIVNQSRSHVYDDPISNDSKEIRFTPWDSSVHEKFRNQMREMELPFMGSKRGLSWVDPERLTCMSSPLQQAIELQPTEVTAGNSISIIERLDLSGISMPSGPSSERLDSLNSSTRLPEDIEEITDV